jgi:Family of unknown function (DUF6527)
MPKLTRISLKRVHYIPKTLEPGFLYVSEEFGAALHLCACGCGTKVSTPLGLTEWTLEETTEGPSLKPSVGNWQLPCQSHYWISKGEIFWGDTWKPEQIRAGRKAEQSRRHAHYRMLEHKRKQPLHRFWGWIKGLFK